MSIPILYKANETNFGTLGLGPLTDAVSCLVTEERNGLFELEVKYPADGLRFEEIKNDRLIKVDAGNFLKDQRFKIIRITKPHDGIVTVYAEHVSYLAQDLALKPNVPYSGNASAALNTWKNNFVDDHPFTVYSDIATEGSGRWTIDKVENARRALGGVAGSILDTYGGEYRFDNYHVGLYTQRGSDNGALIAYGKNLTELTQEEEIASTYTSVYPYSVVRDEETDEERVVTLPEYFIDSEYVGNYARRKILVVDFSQEEIETEDALRKRTERYIEQNEVGVPKVNLKVKFVDLAKTLDYKDLEMVEEINLCDWVTIYFEKFDIYQKAKVIKTVWDVLLDQYDSIEVGEARASLSKSIEATVDERIEPVATQLNVVQIAANGKNKIFRGPDEPVAGMSTNDLWFRPIGDGEKELYQWNGSMWERIVSSAVNDETRRMIEEAENIAENARTGAEEAQKMADSIKAGLGVGDAVDVHEDIVAGIKANIGDKIQDNSDAISAVMETPEGTIIGYNELKETAEGNFQTIARIKESPGTEIADYHRITETADLYERVIGGSEAGIRDNVARIVMADNLFQTEVTDVVSGMSTEVSQLSDSWAVKHLNDANDIVSQINLSSDVLIQGKNIVLDGNTIVDGSFTVTDEFFAENMSIDKFTTGTLNAAEVNLINVNVDSLVGNTSDFIRSQWNAALGGSTYIDGTEIKSTGVDGEEISIGDGALNFYNKNGQHLVWMEPTYSDTYEGDVGFGINLRHNRQFSIIRRKTTAPDEVIMRINPLDEHVTFLNDVTVGRLRIKGTNQYLLSRPQGGVSLIDSHAVRLGIGRPDNWTDVLTINENHNVDLYGRLRMNDSNIADISDVEVNSHLYIRRSRASSYYARMQYRNINEFHIFANGGLLLGEIYNGQWERLMALLHGGIQMYRSLNMNSNSIINNSDARLKNVYGETVVSALKHIRETRFVDYEWKESTRPQGVHMGVIAQETPWLVVDDPEAEYLSIDSSKQIMYNSLAIQEVDKQVLQLANRLEVMDADTQQALSETQRLNERINELEERINQLEAA